MSGTTGKLGRAWVGVLHGAWFGDVCTHAFSPPQHTSPPHHHHHHHACTMPCSDPCTNPSMAQLARHPRPQSCPHPTSTEQHYMILLLVLSHISSFVNLFLLQGIYNVIYYIFIILGSILLCVIFFFLIGRTKACLCRQWV